MWSRTSPYVQVKNHVDIMETLDLIDFDAAAEVSGSKFYYLRNAGALLELALVNMTMQVRVKGPLHLVTTPPTQAAPAAPAAA